MAAPAFPFEPILLQSVWKSYGKQPALKGLSLFVPPGSVYAFLGPNGAGKSTTIRLLLGLQRADRGTVSLFGQEHHGRPGRLLRRVGALIESPTPYLHLTGRENLEVHRLLADHPRDTIDEALTLVGLSGDAHRRVRTYSTGMKQRLGIAQALLGRPELLILDEPTNGLDPAGIAEVRELIRTLPERWGTTVFLSSHLLAEVEQVATHCAVIARGELRQEGSMESFRASSREYLYVEADPLPRAAELLASLGLAAEVADGLLKLPMAPKLDTAALNQRLVAEGLAVRQLYRRRTTLEELFLRLTSEIA